MLAYQQQYQQLLHQNQQQLASGIGQDAMQVRDNVTHKSSFSNKIYFAFPFREKIRK
jgi:hypothetical protein